MEYYGIVNCRCYQDQKTETPPYEEAVEFRKGEWVLNRSVSSSTDVPYFKKEQAFEQWKKSACTHPNMEYAKKLLGNEFGLDDFKAYLLKNGGEQAYAALLKSLPDNEANVIMPEQAKTALVEVQLLKKRAQLTTIDKSVLREKETGNLIMIGDYDARTFFAVLENDHVFMLKGDMFFILDRSEAVRGNLPVLFQAKSFYTHVFADKNIGFFVDEASEMVQTVRGLGEAKPKGTRTDYEVKREIFKAYTYYQTPITALEELFAAAVKTNNPVVWKQR